MARMLRYTLARTLAKRLGSNLPVGRLLAAADVALMAGHHVAALDPAQRRRALALVRRARARPSTLAQAEREELMELLELLQPRLFLGTAVKRLSPVPLPKRLLYGERGSSARSAAKRG